jgi:hypothetical protein
MWFYNLPRDVQIDVLAVLAPDGKTTDEGRTFWTSGA